MLFSRDFAAGDCMERPFLKVGQYCLFSSVGGNRFAGCFAEGRGQRVEGGLTGRPLLQKKRYVSRQEKILSIRLSFGGL